MLGRENGGRSRVFIGHASARGTMRVHQLVAILSPGFLLMVGQRTPRLGRLCRGMPTYLTIYCGRHHRISDGFPVKHSCRVLDPEYLKAEQIKDYDRASALLEQMPLILHDEVGSTSL